jgi:hypothetical protein
MRQETDEQLWERLGVRFGPDLSASECKPEPKPQRPKVTLTREDGVETIRLLEPPTGHRMIRGIASTGRVNGHGYSLDPRGCMIQLPFPILSDHAWGPPIGEVILARKSQDGVFIHGVVHEDSLAADHAWKLICDGKLVGLSGAFAPDSLRLAGVVDGCKFYDRWRLAEVSLCRKGANPDCWCQIIRDDA